MKKTLCILLAVVMVIGALAGCGSSAAPAASSATAFKIGGTGPLTGGAAIYGNAVKNAAEIAVEEINAMGGIQFDLRFEDDTHDAEKAVNAYLQALRGHLGRDLLRPDLLSDPLRLLRGRGGRQGQPVPAVLL